MSSTSAPDAQINQKITLQSYDIPLNVTAGTRDVATALNGDVYLLDYSFYVVNAGLGLVSVSIQTNNTTSIPLLTAAEGALSALTGDKFLKSGSLNAILALGKKIQYTTVGNGSAGLLRLYIRTMQLNPDTSLS